MSFQVSLKAFSIQVVTRTHKACQQCKLPWNTVHVESICPSAPKFPGQLNKKKSVSCKKKRITKTLSIWSCLLQIESTNSPPGFPSLRKMHSRIVANSLLDCTAAAQLNMDCWICLWRARNAPSPRKSILLFPNVPCIWQDKSLSPKDSTQTNTNKQNSQQSSDC